jgi:hypothetical protein
MAGAKSPRCPLCGSEFAIKYVEIGSPFRCPVCGEYLFVPRSYSVFWIYAALFISGLLCFGFGARGANIFWYTLLIWIPVYFIAIFWSRHFAPPKLKPTSRPNAGPLGL